MHAVEDPKPINDSGVLTMVHDIELCANWIRHQLLWLEVDRPTAEAESVGTYFDEDVRDDQIHLELYT